MGEQLLKMPAHGLHLRMATRPALRGQLPDCGGQRSRVSRAVGQPRPAQRMFGRAAAIGHDHRHPAGPGFGGSEAKCLRLAAVDQGIGAGDDRREFCPLALRLEQANMRIIANCGANRGFISACTQQRQLRIGVETSSSLQAEAAAGRALLQADDLPSFRFSS